MFVKKIDGKRKLIYFKGKIFSIKYCFNIIDVIEIDFKKYMLLECEKTIFNIIKPLEIYNDFLTSKFSIFQTYLNNSSKFPFEETKNKTYVTLFLNEDKELKNGEEWDVFMYDKTIEFFDAYKLSNILSKRG